ncbi:MAG: aspartate aminotransferase family protein [Acidobacteriota bacterium]|nr:aspartate aminotransferase family protein [Acidobacteriota bacterium]MDE3030961.1 aspartate aminotransferase family protein [Acidobacteriota bacterium]MDE3093283.1 aspartate aminotransferase family protein [Acidobacteriota bacterium]MDE3138844.1 aspartate aminotransferase family protein [Acidobacteriota bacterium]
MSINEIYTDGIAVSDDNQVSHSYSQRARRNLWLQMSRMGSYSEQNEVPIIVRGEGTRVYDANGKEYFDGISGLFTNALGHGRPEFAVAAAESINTLTFFPIWTYAHPKAIELAEKLASLAPGDLNRVFFTTGGAEANESAWKLARQYHRLRGDTDRYKVISRDIAYHGTTLGALTITSLENYRQPFEPLVPGAVKVPAVNFYRAERHADDFEAFGLWSAQQIEEALLREGPETVAAVFLEPVQNAGGCFTPPPGYWREVREICDRYGVVLVSDEVICAFGRLGTWFGGQKYDYVPDIITCAKGITAGYAPLGAMIVSDRLAEPFQSGDVAFQHGFTWAGHPLSAAMALTSIGIIEREHILDNVLDNQEYFHQSLLDLKDIPIVGDVRGTGYFWGVELVKDQETKETWQGEEAERLLRGFVSPEMFRRGLICRSDDRGDPVVQLAPPLISTREDIDFMVGTLREVFTEAADRKL